MAFVAVIAACLLAFGNGANDNAKGVATLIGAGALSTRHALIYAAIATFLGSVAAMLLAGNLLARFSGKGLVDTELLASAAFPACVGLAAALTVLIATRMGMPISTTHALVGGLVGAGLSAGALHLRALIDAFLIPLLAAPAMATVLAATVYLLVRRARRQWGVTSQTCVCIENRYHPIRVGDDGTMTLAASGVRLSDEHTLADCQRRYGGRIVGLDAQRVLDGSHLITAGAISFARGLNDTPKMAAILIAGGALSSGSAMVAIGVAIAMGGLLAVRRVAATMSERITGMNDGQAFTANLVTAALVIFASRLGVPVSTTHVSCGSLFGIGTINGQAHWRVIGQVILAWVTTLPLAGLIGWLAWRLLGTA